VALTARDSDIIKTYVRIGLGVGILASLAVDPVVDSDLAVLDASHLLDGHTTWVGFRRGALAPHLPRKLVRAVEKSENQQDVDRLVSHIKIPRRDNP
jgi:LysR family cys regulon transcriptional activator